MSDKTTDKRLLPCPFCGGEAKHSTVFGRCGIVCKDCLCEMRGWLDSTPEDLIEAWNTRKPMKRIVKKLGASSIMLATSKEYWENPQKGGNTMEVIPIQDAIEIVKEEM